MILESVYIDLLDSVTGLVVSRCMCDRELSVDDFLNLIDHDVDYDGQIINDKGELIDAYYDSLCVKRELFER